MGEYIESHMNASIFGHGNGTKSPVVSDMSVWDRLQRQVRRKRTRLALYKSLLNLNANTAILVVSLLWSERLWRLEKNRSRKNSRFMLQWVEPKCGRGLWSNITVGGNHTTLRCTKRLQWVSVLYSGESAHEPMGILKWVRWHIPHHQRRILQTATYSSYFFDWFAVKKTFDAKVNQPSKTNQQINGSTLTKKPKFFSLLELGELQWRQLRTRNKCDPCGQGSSCSHCSQRLAQVEYSMFSLFNRHIEPIFHTKRWVLRIKVFFWV